jgi:Mce-associated membrane protein
VERQRRGGGGVRLVPVVVLIAVLAADAVLFFRPRGDSTHDVVSRAVLTAARQEAVNLTTISYTSAARDLDRIVAGATGGLRQQFEAQRAQFPAVLSRDKSVSRGWVLSAGLISLSDHNDAAQVAVATDATVSTTGGGTTPQSVVKHYRMVMKLQLVRGRWLVTDVAFAGVPQ